MRRARIVLVRATKKKNFFFTNPWQNLILTLPLYMQEVLLTVSLLAYTMPWHDFIMALIRNMIFLWKKNDDEKNTHSIPLSRFHTQSTFWQERPKNNLCGLKFLQTNIPGYIFCSAHGNLQYILSYLTFPLTNVWEILAYNHFSHLSLCHWPFLEYSRWDQFYFIYLFLGRGVCLFT